MQTEWPQPVADLILRGGSVIDGTGAPTFTADVAVDNDRISAVGDLSAMTAARVIDVSGLTVAPGLIDTHAHSDGVLLRDPVHAHGLVQGVTTECITQDGLSYALLSDEQLDSYGRYIAGLYGPPPRGLDVSTMSAFLSHYDGKGCNVVALAPHGPVRLESVGFADVPLEGAGLAAAERMVAEAMEQGAVGFSTGLSYYPNSYSDTDELVALNRVVARYGGVYVTHIRNHNDDRAPDGSGIVEAMNIGRRTGVKVHISHYRTFPSNAGQIDSIMSEVDRAKAEGVDVTLECYPYAAAATVPGYFLRGECHIGGVDRLLERLRDLAWRDRLVDSLEHLFPGRSDAAAWTWIGADQFKHLQGRSFADSAALLQMSVSEMMLAVMRESGLQCGFRDAAPTSGVVTRQIEADVIALLSRDDYMVGSDGIPFEEGLPHPRAYGTFPRILGRLRRRLGVSLEHLVRSMTSLPAERFGLADRGVLAVGKFADLVVFDAGIVTDTAEFHDPRTPPVGIPYVLVNGQVAVDAGQATGALGGRALSSSYSTTPSMISC